MKPFKPLPSREYLLDTFTYDNGKLLWKVPPSNTTIRVGDEAGWIDSRGWRSVRTNGHILRVHRIIYEMCVGGLTITDEIDHINRVRDDNRIENLRLATRSQQMRNRISFDDWLMNKYRTLVNTDGSLV